MKHFLFGHHISYNKRLLDNGPNLKVRKNLLMKFQNFVIVVLHCIYQYITNIMIYKLIYSTETSYFTACSFVVSDLRSETIDSRIESGC